MDRWVGGNRMGDYGSTGWGMDHCAVNGGGGFALGQRGW